MVRMGSPVRFRQGLHIGSDQWKRWSGLRLGPVERAMLVVLVFGVVLNGRMPDGEHFPG
jgi:hypothetical protein